jgi:hypothetical protein
MVPDGPVPVAHLLNSREDGEEMSRVQTTRTAAPVVSGGRWIERRRHRYKRHPMVGFSDVKNALRTGDIIMFHKTTRTGIIDSLELDFVSPLFFRATEFRHSGIIVRRDDGLFVLECAEERHSGHAFAEYPTGGRGIRIVPLVELLDAYTRDNGSAHYGVRFISTEINPERVQEALGQYGPVDYLKMQRSVPLYLTKFLLPAPLRRSVLEAWRHEMMCSEFVHSILNRCGALADYPSKLLAPYSIEDDDFFRRLEVVRFSDIVRFDYPVLDTN